ncbi:MAG: hypothetical protein JJE35_01690 [Thermoleophilia bacterium]|nr:hypothetical protein [Thermoleophilia bacterium]
MAGQPTYTLRVAPKHDGGLLGGAEVAWDANHGTPRRPGWTRAGCATCAT